MMQKSADLLYGRNRMPINADWICIEFHMTACTSSAPRGGSRTVHETNIMIMNHDEICKIAGLTLDKIP